MKRSQEGSFASPSFDVEPKQKSEKNKEQKIKNKTISPKNFEKNGNDENRPVIHFIM